MKRVMFVSGVLACLGTLCLAQPSVEQTRPLPELVVTATRDAREINSVPNAVYRLDAAAKLLAEGVRTTPDMLEGVPSVLVQKTSYGQGSPYIRGFTGFRNLLLIDGIRLNNSVFRDGPNQYWNTVDPLSIAGYELVMGPASVLYGSDAIGGTLNALTIAPPAYEGAPELGGRLLYRGSSAEASHTGRIQIGGRTSEQFGFAAGLSAKDFGDLRGGKDVGEQDHTGYTEMGFDLRGDWRLGEDALLTLCHQSLEQEDAWRTHKTIYGISWEGTKVGDDLVHSFDQGRQLTYLKYRGKNPGGFADAVECTLSRNLQTEDLYRVKKDAKGTQQGFDCDTLGAALQIESDSALGRWVYGAEYYRDNVDSYSRKYKSSGAFDKTEIQGPVADDATYDSLGVYVQNSFAMSDGGAEFVPGLRYTDCRADAGKVADALTGRQTSVEGDWHAVVGSLRLLCPLSRDRRHVAFAGVGQGFRAPNLSDLTRLDIARSDEIETPSPDLDPEDYVTYEIGLKSRFDRLTSQLCCYHTAIDGMIVRTPTGRVIDEFLEVTKKNAGEGYVRGVELTARYDISPCWSGWLAGSVMDGEVDGYPSSDAALERDYVSRLMPPTAEIGLRWQGAGAKCWCELVGNAAAKADKLSDSDERDTQRIPPGGTPGYAVCRLRAGAKLTGSLSVSLGVENLFDEDYRIHGSGVNEPGRNAILTAACDF